MHPILPLPAHRHPPSTPRDSEIWFRMQKIQFLWSQAPAHLNFYQSGLLLNMCTFDIFSSSSYTYCLFHLGAISPSYFSQITDVIAERFVLVPLHGSGKRSRKKAQTSLHPAAFPVLHFLWSWGYTCIFISVRWCKNMLSHWPLSNSTPLVNEKSVGGNFIHGAECGKGQVPEMSGKTQAVCVSL